MSRVSFDSARPVVESDPARADVVCFVGLVRATGAPLPGALQDWLKVHGWTEGKFARPVTPPFTDLPIPIDGYGTFTALFDPGGSGSSFGTDYLAAAVRSFFAQGGRRCYVIRMSDPLSPGDDATAKLAELLPDDLFAVDDRRSWHGTGHLGGLPDVCFLSLPDLPLLLASAPVAAKGAEPVSPSGPANFVECSTSTPTPKPPLLFDHAAPRLTPADYTQWARAVNSVLVYLRRNDFREVQFVAAFPLPQDVNAAAAMEHPSSAALAQDIHEAIQEHMPEIPGEGLSTAYLQLAYPWLKTSGSHVLQESLEPPDGALVGMLARNALVRGAFKNATKIVPVEIFDVVPSLPDRDMLVPATPLSWDGTSKPLITRLSLFGFTPGGLRLLSDVTAYPGESYRPARIHRLISVISRASRRLGDQITFRANDAALWARVEKSLQQLMLRLWTLNALDGATIQDAFTVRCDASTMTQNDLDNGRLIAQVTFTAAATIELIRITLALETGGASALGISQLAEAS